MNKSVTDMKTKATDYWETLTPKVKKIAIAVSVAVLVAAVVVVYFLYRDEYVPLYSGMSAEESGEVIVLLESAGVKHYVEGDTIYVLKEEKSEIEMQLAMEGYPKETLTYDTFTSSLDWASTEFEQQQAFIFQTQERLQDSIETLDGVESAIVTISLPEDNSYALSEDVSSAGAGVILDLAPGVELTSEEVTGIQELVVKSVPGLTSENVVITDETGKQLNSGGSESESDTEAASSQLELEEYAADQIEQNILELFIPIFGEDGVKVACKIEIDFSKTITQEDTYEPVNGDEGIPDSSSTTYQGSADAANGGVPGTESNSGTDTYETPEGDASGETISTTEQIDYLVNHMSEYTESDQGVIENVTISVLINQESITPEEQETYTSLAANAAGVPEEAVVVEAVPFEAANAAEEETQKQVQKSQVTQTVRGVGILIFLLIALKIVVSFLKKIFRKGSDDDDDDDDDDDEELEAVDKVLEKARLNKENKENQETKARSSQDDIKSMFGEDAAENEQRKQIMGLADDSPEVVAEIIKSLLRGEEK